MPLHQGQSDAGFQFAQPAVDGGLVYAESLSGGQRAAVARDGYQMAKIAPVDHAPLCTFASRFCSFSAACRNALSVEFFRPYGRKSMHHQSDVKTMIAGLTVGLTRSAQESGMAKLTPLHREVVGGMPIQPEQEIRVLFSTLLPGDVTPYHSHRFPVTVYMLEGTFMLELDGRESLSITAGEVL